MYGIYGTYNPSLTYPTEAVEGRVMYVQDMVIAQKTLDKFLKDKPFVQTDIYAYALEGVILNRKQLEQQYGIEWPAALYEKEGETFFNLLRGSFHGIFYDKRQRTCLIFTDHIGSKPLFYHISGNKVFFDCDIQRLGQTTQLYTADLLYAYSMLTFGYSPTEHTPIENIFRLQAGEYLRISPTEVRKITYHHFSNIPRTNNPQDVIAQMDSLFRQALQRILDKNKEYGLKNLMPLSAGLDSRMTVMVAHQLETNIETFTFSQTNYFDQNYAYEISKHLGIAWHFVPLDNGEYLHNIDSAVQHSNMQLQYAGPAQVEFGMSRVPHSQTGVIATGMLGDIIVNSFMPQKPYYFGLGAFSKTLLSRLATIVPKDFMTQYSDADMYYIMVRGLMFANLGSPSIFQQFTESCSPFADVDFMEYCLQLPHYMRWNYSIYDQWILQCYPHIAQWRHNGKEIIGHRPTQVVIAGRTMPIQDVIGRLFRYCLNKFHLGNNYKLEKEQSMNPLDSWLAENKNLKDDWNNYFASHLPLIKKSLLQKDILHLFTQGNAVEQISVLTYLSIVHQLGLQFD
ncbi:MAG: hypothetical protein KBS70_02090 [Bacteroidales bacterium]|nr:hypothetical protein [Candidatus Colicola equi]